MSLLFVLRFIGVMITIALADMCWARYMIFVAEKKALPSAIWGTLIMVGSIIGVRSYTTDDRMIAAVIIGGFFGTYFTVKREAKKKA